MRKIVVFAALMLSLTATMAAAEKGEFFVGGTGGMAVPTGDFGDFADPGFAGGVFGDYTIANGYTIGVTMLYSGLAGSDDFKTAASLDDADFTMLQFTPHARYFFPTGGQFMPFVTVGGGYYSLKLKASSGGVEGEETDNNGGIFGGIGADFAAGPMWRVGAEGTYHNIFTEGESTQVIGVAGRLSFSFAAQTQ